MDYSFRLVFQKPICSCFVTSLLLGSHPLVIALNIEYSLAVLQAMVGSFIENTGVKLFAPVRLGSYE